MTERAERPSLRWDGALTIQGMNGEFVQERDQIARAVAADDWAAMMPLLSEYPDLVNMTLRRDRSWSTLLHWAAANDAPEEFVRELTRLGAFRSVRDPAGKRAIDIVASKERQTLVELFDPKLEQTVSPEHLSFMQELFHGLIRAAMLGYHVSVPLRLPQLSILTERQDIAIWFPVPGMAGGFHFWLEKEEHSHVLLAESWSRIVGGSGMRHRITPFEVILLEEGFV
jgi:hypothetical protein